MVSFRPNMEKILSGKKRILDIGSGSVGSSWWNLIDKNSEIVGIDINFFPKKLPENTKIYRFDANNLGGLEDETDMERYLNGQFIAGRVKWLGQFDLVVANHVLEHVEFPEKVIEGIRKVLTKNGSVYAGFPESDNFTDIFYHLIHPEGGGHIQKLSLRKVKHLFESRGFKLLSSKQWPDDWEWFEKLYDYKGRGIKFINNDEIKYLADTFRKELTHKKGYYYGWEVVFKKI